MFTVDIWSDVVCPWCYIGKRRFEQALAEFPHRDVVTVRWHSFELDPNAERRYDGTMDEVLAKKYGISRIQAMGMMQNVTNIAATLGLQYDFGKVQQSNSFDAHRLLHYAYEHGKQDAMKERLLRAYFTEGRLLSDHTTLAELASEVGLSADDVATMLASDAYANAVREDEQFAAQGGIRGVPFFLFDQKYGVSGAQEPESMLQAMHAIWEAEQGG